MCNKINIDALSQFHSSCSLPQRVPRFQSDIINPTKQLYVLICIWYISYFTCISITRVKRKRTENKSEKIRWFFPFYCFLGGVLVLLLKMFFYTTAYESGLYLWRLMRFTATAFFWPNIPVVRSLRCYLERKHTANRGRSNDKVSSFSNEVTRASKLIPR